MSENKESDKPSKFINFLAKFDVLSIVAIVLIVIAMFLHYSK